jgi:ParB/RepB/Spo0J family partition protein
MDTDDTALARPAAEISSLEPEAQREPADAPTGSIRLARVVIGTTNPRKRFDEAALAELTESIRRHGVLQPILVRPLPDERYELVSGERRFRAATAAGLRTIPALVREMGDQEVLEVQLVENLQRAGLHELEEAEGYERLMQDHAYTVDELAVKVGKSKTYVYARLKLTDLCAKARDAFYSGKLNASTALLVARIPLADLQIKAVKEITEHWVGGMPYRQAAEHVQRTYMLRLDQAPFPRHDAGLVPAAGACGACPKRTGNAPELFGDVTSADVCTDPACFKSKRDAHAARVKAQAEERGQKVLQGKAAESALRGDYVRLEQHDHTLTGSGKTYKQLLGKTAPAPVLIELDDGTLIETLPKKELVEALQAKGHKVRVSSRTDAERAAERKAQAERAYRERLLSTILPKLGERKHYDLGLVVHAMWGEMHHDSRMKLLARRGWGAHEVVERVEALDQEARYYLLVEMSMTPDLTVNTYNVDRKPERLLALAAALEVDAAQIKRDAAADERAKEKAKAAKAKKPAASKASKASDPKPAARRAKKPAPIAEAAPGEATSTAKVAIGDRVRVIGELPGRSAIMKRRLQGVVSLVTETFVDGRVRIAWGPGPQHKAWLKATEYELVAGEVATAAEPVAPAAQVSEEPTE